MKNVAFAIGVLGAGLVGAVGGRFLFPAETGADGLETPAPTESRIEELETRMNRLSEELRVVREARLAPASGSVPETVLPVLPELDAPTAVNADMTVPPPADESAAAADEDPLTQKVVEIIEAREREQWRKKAQWAEAAQRKKEAQWLGTLREPLGLTDGQIGEMLRLLAERRVFAAAMKRRWNAQGLTESDQATLKAESDDYRRRLDGDLRALLSATQYDGVIESARNYGKR